MKWGKLRWKIFLKMQKNNKWTFFVENTYDFLRNIVLFSDDVYSRLDFYMRGYFYVQSRNRDLIRRNNNLRREIRQQRATIEEHEDFIFGPLLFDYE